MKRYIILMALCVALISHKSILAAQAGSALLPYEASASTSCPHDPQLGGRCSGADLSDSHRVDVFWRKLITMVVEEQGYATPEQIERTLGIRFSSIVRDTNGQVTAHYEGDKGAPALSIQLDDYPANGQLPRWQRAQGAPMQAYSVLNVAYGDLGCVPLQNAQKLLLDAGLVKKGSIVYQTQNEHKSRSEFSGRNEAASITLYYGIEAITMPCVESVRVVGLRRFNRH